MNATVTLDVVQQTVTRAIARFPLERPHIERAATLVALGHVEQIGPDVFTVRSQTDASVTYRVDVNGCPCIDSQRHPGQSCKHAWAIDLILVARERQRRLNARGAEQSEHVVTSADAVALAYARRIGWAA